MMRLVDQDDLIERILDMYCKECNDHNGVMCRSCRIDDAISVVDDAPIVDAISMEWLLKFRNNMSECLLVDAIDVIINVWKYYEQKEGG